MRRKESIVHLPSILMLTVLLLSSLPVFGRDFQVRVNAADYLYSSAAEHVSLKPGLRSQTSVALADDEYHYDGETELLLNFNGSIEEQLAIDGQAYIVRSNRSHVSAAEYYRGSSSAMFLRGGGVELYPSMTSLFSPGAVWGDFTIEFWMYPAQFSDGEELLAWEGISWLGDIPVSQEILIFADEGKLRWDFRNVFIEADPGAEEVNGAIRAHSATLSSRTEIVPRRWMHHMLRYNSSTGLLEYCIDGRTEAVMYMTSTGGESGTPFLPYIGERSEPRLMIAPDFHGFLDDFRISKNWVEEPKLEKLENHAGYAVIGPIDLNADNIRLTGFSAEYRTPGLTGISFSIAQRDRYRMLSDDQLEGFDVWKSVTPGTDGQLLIPEGFGRYVYVRVELYPDGTSYNVPLLQSITLKFEEDPAPPAPFVLMATAEDGSVLLEWDAVAGADVTGYILYWGDSPGNYLAGPDAPVPSPVDVGNVTRIRISGLENGKMYYFRLASYNSSNSPLLGLYRERNMTEEVYARPSRTDQ